MWLLSTKNLVLEVKKKKSKWHNGYNCSSFKITIFHALMTMTIVLKASNSQNELLVMPSGELGLGLGVLSGHKMFF